MLERNVVCYLYRIGERQLLAESVAMGLMGQQTSRRQRTGVGKNSGSFARIYRQWTVATEDLSNLAVLSTIHHD